MPSLDGLPPAGRAQTLDVEQRFAAHQAVHMLEPRDAGMRARGFLCRAAGGTVTRHDLASATGSPHASPPQSSAQDFLDGDRAARYHHVNVTAHDHGGHFIPWEIPTAWIDDLRRIFHEHR